MLSYTKVKRQITVGATPGSKYLAVLWRGNDVTVNQIAEEISEATSLSVADVEASLSALEMVIKRHIKNGEAVKFPRLGHFIPCISAKTQATADKVTADTITKKGVRFYPTVSFRKEMKDCGVVERKENPAGYVTE